ncbi:short tail fibers protein [Yersinia phage JC221]|nr:short tail fibers protein [Yersinia phage JC221]
MANNTINHVSDSSSYVIFDPSGTDWPSTYTNVQQTLAALGSWARKDVGLPTASDTKKGIIQIATQADIDAGTDNTKVVTPKLLAYRMGNPKASQTVYGYTKYATDAESVTVTNDLVSMTPRSFNYAMNTRRATEVLSGSIRLSTTAQATSGTDDTTAMTPLKVKQAVAALVPVQANATESVTGLVRLATVAQVQAGTIKEGYAISPYTMMRLTASYNDFGLVKFATPSEVAAGNEQSKVVTPFGLLQMKGSGSQYGLVALTPDVSGGLPNHALSANANVLPSNRSSVLTNGDIYRDSMNANKKYQTREEVELSIPIGGLIMTAFWFDYGNIIMCDGRGLNRNTYPVLFSRIGYSFGGSGDIFNIPDFRGLAPRGYDAGRGMDPSRSFGSYQEDMFKYHEHPLQMIYRNGGNLPAWQSIYELKEAEKNDQLVRTFDQTFTKAVGVGGNETRMKNLAIGFGIRVQ